MRKVLHQIASALSWVVACAGLLVALGCCAEHAAVTAMTNWRQVGCAGLAAALVGVIGAWLLAPSQLEPLFQNEAPEPSENR